MPNDTVDFESEYWRLAEAVYALMETDPGKRAAFLMPDEYRAALEQSAFRHYDNKKMKR